MPGARRRSRWYSQAWQARTRAERIADQAAVRMAEGRPIPAELKDDADVSVAGRTVRVTLPVELLGRDVRVTAEARVS